MMFMHSICVKKGRRVKRGDIIFFLQLKGGILSFFSFKMMFKRKYLPFYSKTCISLFFGENKNSKWKEKNRSRPYIYIGGISDTDTVIISVTQHKYV